MMRNNRTGEDGSILIEALAALVIISVAVITSLSGFADAIGRCKKAEIRLAALAVARNLINEIIASDSLSISRSQGVSEDGFEWTATIAGDMSFPSNFLVRPFRVTVSVSLAVPETQPVLLDTIVVGIFSQTR